MNLRLFLVNEPPTTHLRNQPNARRLIAVVHKVQVRPPGNALRSDLDESQVERALVIDAPNVLPGAVERA